MRSKKATKLGNAESMHEIGKLLHKAKALRWSTFHCSKRWNPKKVTLFYKNKKVWTKQNFRLSKIALFASACILSLTLTMNKINHSKSYFVINGSVNSVDGGQEQLGSHLRRPWRQALADRREWLLQKPLSGMECKALKYFNAGSEKGRASVQLAAMVLRGGAPGQRLPSTWKLLKERCAASFKRKKRGNIIFMNCMRACWLAAMKFQAIKRRDAPLS